MQVSRLCTFQLPWVLLKVFQPVCIFLRKQCFQNLRFYNKYLLLADGVYKKISCIPKPEKRLYISPIGQGDWINIFPSGTERIAKIDQCTKSHVGSCGNNQKAYGCCLFYRCCFHKASHEKSHQVNSHQCFYQKSVFLKIQSKNQHAPGTSSMEQYLCRKNHIRQYI